MNQNPPSDSNVVPNENLGLGTKRLKTVRNNNIPLLGGMLVVALGMRLFLLGARPLWIDEFATLGFASLPWPELFGPIARLEPTPPTYYAFIKLWLGLNLASRSEVLLRLPSAIAGTASLVPLFLFCCRAFGLQAAIWSTALLAVSAQHLHYSQEARVYGILFLVFSCGLLAAQHLTVNTEKRRCIPVFALGVFTAILIYLHSTGVFIAASIYVYGISTLLAQRRLSIKTFMPYVLAGCGGLALAAPWLIITSDIVRSSDSAIGWMKIPSVADTMIVFRNTLFAPFLYRLAVPGLALSFGALVVCVWRQRQHPQALGILAALSFSLFIFYGISQVRPILLERTILFCLAFTGVLVGAGLATIRRKWLIAMLALAAFVPQILGVFNQYTQQSHYGEDWRAAGTYLAREVGQKDVVLVLGPFEGVAAEFYLGKEGAARRIFSVISPADRLASNVVQRMTAVRTLPDSLETAQLCATLGDAQSIWVLSRAPEVYPDSVHALVDALMNTGARLIEEQKFGVLPMQHWSALSCADYTNSR